MELRTRSVIKSFTVFTLFVIFGISFSLVSVSEVLAETNDLNEDSKTTDYFEDEYIDIIDEEIPYDSSISPSHQWIVSSFNPSYIGEDFDLDMNKVITFAIDNNILKGDGSGVDETYLDSTLNRMSALILYLRVTQQEEFLMTRNEDTNFVDVTTNWQGGRNILSAVYNGAIFGWEGFDSVDENGQAIKEFRGDEPITYEAYIVALLKMNAYMPLFDYEDNPLELASQLGLNSVIKEVNETLTIREAMILLIEAMATKNNGQGYSNLELLGFSNDEIDALMLSE